ncbi:MAG TPA: MDR family MFS transporter [Stellaceae bacterium]|nr:MDR family MFS transporter [Stellaceae bacterium]
MPIDEAEPQVTFTRAAITSILAGLLLSMFLASIDQTIVATALTTIARDLNGWDQMAWVVSAYLVTSTVTTPIHGRLSDLYGRRPILLIAILFFVGASVLCALAWSMPTLVIGRAIQGIGGGGLRSVSQAALADIIPPRDRGRYQGYFAGVFIMSNALGPVLGGFFAQDLSWHWIFWINLPLGIAAFMLSSHALKQLRVPQRRAAIDWWGALLILVSATPILIGVSNAERAGGWASPEAWGPIAAGLVATLLLVLRERMTSEAMLPLRLFVNPVFVMSILVTLLVQVVMTALLVLIPLNYQLGAGLPPDQIGTLLIPLTVGSVVGSAASGALISRTGRYRIYPVAGSSIAAVTCAAIGYIGLGRSLVFDTVATGILGLAWGGQFSPLTIAVQNALPWQDTGTGLSCFQFFRLIGGAFGVAILSTALIGFLGAGAMAVPGHEALGANPGLALLHLEEPGTHLPPALVTALSGAIHTAFAHLYAVSTVILALSVVPALLLREVPLRSR